jgi:hypothetical protein
MRKILLSAALPLLLLGACSQAARDRLGTAAEQAQSGAVAMGSAAKTAASGFSQAYGKLKQSWQTASGSSDDSQNN